MDKLTVETVTEGAHTLGGKGTFDVFMEAAMVHLKGEYSAGRITGNAYASAFVSILGNVYQVASQYASAMVTTNNDSLIKQGQLDLYIQQLLTEKAKIQDEVEGQPVKGAVGIDNALKQANITAYEKRSVSDAIKLILDTWTVRASTNTGYTAPDNYNRLHDSNIGNAIERLFCLNNIDLSNSDGNKVSPSPC